VLLDVVGVDRIGFQVAVSDRRREGADGGGELVFAAETDVHLDRRVGGEVVVGGADGDRSGTVDVVELALQRRDGGLVEDAHGDGDAVGTVLERPVERILERVVRALLQQVALRDNDRDVVGPFVVLVAQASGEISVVQTHAKRLSAA
jgi:hypothetical protein